MKFHHLSVIITFTSLIFNLIGQCCQVQFVFAENNKSSIRASAKFYEPIVVATNEPFILMRFVFNNGSPANETTFCTDEDYIIIMEAFPLSMQGRRLDSEDVMTNTSSRELYPPFCATACKGYAPGTCRATRCVGYRRRNLRENFQAVPSINVAEVDAICSSTMALLHRDIDNLIVFDKVSSTCKTFLARSTRETYCAFCNP